MRKTYSSLLSIVSLYAMSSVMSVGCSALPEGASSSGKTMMADSDNSATTSKSGSGSTESTTGAGGSRDDLEGSKLPQGEAGDEKMTPVRLIPKLVSMTFHERTGGEEPTASTFNVDGPELGKRLDDPLTDTNSDIRGADGEFYDVYYSDADGTFNVDGSYLTISGVFSQIFPAGGGLNLAEIGLNFQGAPTEYGNYVASYAVLGDNKEEKDVEKCIDGDLQTHTTMGNTAGSKERLRLTLGFRSSSGLPK